MSGFKIGADISPIDFLTGQPDSPSGRDLVSLLVADPIRLVRLEAYAGTPFPALAERLHEGGWRTVFSELERAGIGAVLLIGGEAGPDGYFRWGNWPAEPPTPGFPRPGQVVESTARWVANEAAILADIKAKCGGCRRP